MQPVCQKTHANAFWRVARATYSMEKTQLRCLKECFESLGIVYSKAEKPVDSSRIYLISLATIRGSLLVDNDVRSVDSKLPKKKVCITKQSHVTESHVRTKGRLAQPHSHVCLPSATTLESDVLTVCAVLPPTLKLC
jgi:hypothetical protein